MEKTHVFYKATDPDSCKYAFILLSRGTHFLSKPCRGSATGFLDMATRKGPRGQGTKSAERTWRQFFKPSNNTLWQAIFGDRGKAGAQTHKAKGSSRQSGHGGDSSHQARYPYGEPYLGNKSKHASENHEHQKVVRRRMIKMGPIGPASISETYKICKTNN